MGLDITAYSNLTLTPEHEHTDDCWENDHVFAFAYDGFGRSYRGLAGWELEDEVSPGFRGGRCYHTTDQTETHGFRAGSYTGYGRFREELAGMLGLSPEKDYWGTFDEDLPFYELINFADNEGTIGPDAAKDLLADFQMYAQQFKDAHDEYEIEKYDDWTRACELASQGGLIAFH